MEERKCILAMEEELRDGRSLIIEVDGGEEGKQCLFISVRREG